MNLKSRKEYIEADYVNGVKDQDGRMVIRPLTDKEKEFLNNFYEETINTNFLHDTYLRRLNEKKRSIINTDQVIKLRGQIKELEVINTKESRKRATELKQVLKLLKEQNKEKYASVLEKIEKKMQEIREETLLYPDKEMHKVFYNENNTRNQCAYNKANIISVDNTEIDLDNNMLLIDDQWEDEAIMGIEYERFEEEVNRLITILKK